MLLADGSAPHRLLAQESWTLCLAAGPLFTPGAATDIHSPLFVHVPLFGELPPRLFLFHGLFLCAARFPLTGTEGAKSRAARAESGTYTATDVQWLP